MLPGYARRFSMRGQLRPIADISRRLQMPVVCYPRRWDSISFYLGRDDMRIYSQNQKAQLIADLKENLGTLAFIKSGRFLDEFLQALPESLEFVPLGRQGQVTMGWVQVRRDIWGNVLAVQLRTKCSAVQSDRL